MLQRLLFTIFVLVLLCGVSLGQNLEGHWSFDADFTDSTVNGRDGAGVSGANAAGNIIAGSQIGAGALTLDGSGEHVAITGYKGVTGTAARTVSAWIRADAPNDNQAIASWGNNALGDKWTFRTQDGNGPTDGSLRVEVNGGYIVGTTDLDDGAWHHVAATFANDGTPNVQDVLLYVDGQLEAVSASVAEAINTASGVDVRIGQDFVGRPWDGELDDVGILSEALSPEKIAAIFSLGTHAELGYDLSDDDALFALFESGDPNATVEIDGVTWKFVASGLAGNPGEVAGGNGNFSLLLDSINGAGLQVIPEPASIAIWSLLALVLTGYGYVRRQKP